MADPLSYSRSFSFTDFQASTPQDSLPGPNVDVELDEIAGSLASLVEAVQDIRRSDGKLQNGVVTNDALSVDFSIGFTLRGEWTVGTVYAIGDGVAYGAKFYKALVAHTATSPTQPDLSPATWLYLTDLLGPLPPDGSVSTPKIVDLSVTGSKLATGAVSTAKLADEAVTDDKIKAAAGIRPSKLSAKVPFTGSVEQSLEQHLITVARRPQEFDATAGTGDRTKDIAAINKAIATGSPVYLPYSSTPYYLDGIVTKSGTTIFCDRQQKIVAQDSLFLTNDSAAPQTGVMLKNLQVDMRSATNPNSAAVVMRTSVERQWRARIENVDVIGGYAHTRQDADAINKFTFDVELDSCRAFFCRGTPFLFYNLQGFFFLNECQADFTDDAAALPDITGTLTSTQKTFPGFSISGTAQTSVGVTIKDCSTHGRGGTAGATSAASGLVLRNATAPSVHKFYADLVNGYGIVLDGITLGSFFDLYLQAIGENGLDINNSSGTKFIGVRGRGTKPEGIGNAAQRGVNISASCSKLKFSSLEMTDWRSYAGVIQGSKHRFQGMEAESSGAGWYFSAVADSTISGITADSNAGDGALFENCVRNTISGFRYRSNTGYGRRDTGASNNFNTHTGGVSTGNTVGSVLQVGAGSLTASWIPDSGTPRASDIGAVTV